MFIGVCVAVFIGVCVAVFIGVCVAVFIAGHMTSDQSESAKSVH